eukprot:TRINITY_DN15090_c0_g1_i2.p1 TRINITY_DN15090_c0_g1~~TRINITY_DN15090_c0_g1_i2.p1  ORF type:complete len:508 (+),score=130.64 TRINITY_DN15090_c0_g1_i2:99-1526(+)
MRRCGARSRRALPAVFARRCSGAPPEPSPRGEKHDLRPTAPRLVWGQSNNRRDDDMAACLLRRQWQTKRPPCSETLARNKGSRKIVSLKGFRAMRSESTTAQLVQANVSRSLDTLRRNGFTLGPKTYCAAIACMADLAYLEGAQTFFDQMREDGVEPTVSVYTTMIKAAAAGADLDAARAVWRDMRRDGLTPDGRAYGAMLSALFAARNEGLFLRVFNSLREKNFTIEETHYAMRCQMCRTVDEALALLPQMKADKVCVTGTVYSAILKVALDTADADGAEAVLRRMQEGQHPVPVTHKHWTAVLSVYRARRDPGPNLIHTWERMEAAAGISPSMVPYIVFIGAAADVAGDPMLPPGAADELVRKAEALFEQADKRALTRIPHLWTRLMKVYAAVGDRERGRALGNRFAAAYIRTSEPWLEAYGLATGDPWEMEHGKAPGTAEWQMRQGCSSSSRMYFPAAHGLQQEHHRARVRD